MDTESKDPFPYKIELHVHLDGAVRPETLLEIARERNMKLDTDEETFKDQVILSQPPWSLVELLKRFDLYMPIICGNKDAVSRIAYEFCKDCADYGIRYVEVRYSPHLLADLTTPEKFTPRVVVETVCDAFDKASAEFNIRVKTILCCVVFSPEWSAEVLQLCQDYKSRGVVAIDIACGDLKPGANPKECLHKTAFQRAYELGIHRTVHAGEDGPAAGVKEALDDMHAERIGHGYKVMDDEELYKRAKKDNVHFEVCPLSSVRTGSVPEDLSKHPIHRFIRDKVNFSINTDDPVVLNNNIIEDYDLVMKWGMSEKDIIQTIFNAANSCFAPENEKQEILRELKEVYGAQLC